MDFCVVEEESSLSGIYIDLVRNPERFTGFAGESSWKVWKAIYEQNCFKFLYGVEKKRTLTNSNPVDEDDFCVEKRAFYRVISGLHTSISIHLCYDYLYKETGIWVSGISLKRICDYVLICV
jgi:ERO1-like protein beta